MANKRDIDLRGLTVAQLVAHDIPKRRKGDELADIALSEAVPPLPPATLAFFGARLQGTLLKRGQVVDVDPQLENPALPPAVEQWLKDTKADLVAVSQVAARHLYSVQGGSASEGLLAVSKATVDGKRALALMKLPHEEGLSVELTKVNGKPTLSVTVLGNLTLTENTRVFKAGLFWLVDGTVVGLVSDDQTGEASDIAGFFLTDFLGFRRARQPKVLTKAFREVVTDFISKVVTDEDDKLDYFNALTVELRSNENKIDPVQFVQKHFADVYKEPLTRALAQKGVPTAAFVKDVALLPRQGRGARLKTTGGLTISGDAAAIERVGTAEMDGEHVIVIHDSLKSVT